MKTRLFLGLAVLLSTASAFAQSGETGPLTWVLEDGTLTISGEGEMPDYDGLLDLAPWFLYRESIHTVVIETGVTSIGNFAFAGLTNLTSITISGSVTRIGYWAFKFCEKLSSITIPDSVTTIEGCAFAEAGLISITIPNSVTKIGLKTFYDCKNLTSITIHSGVTSIGEYAFSGCTNLTLITNHNPVPTKIESSVFYKMDQGACTLAVPIGSVSDYQEAEVWKEFNIVGIEVGIVETDNYPSLQVYPNPTSGEIQVTIAGQARNELQVTSIEVYDVMGRKIQSFGCGSSPQRVSGSNFQNLETSKHKTIINLSNLPTGVYFLKIQTDDGAVVRKVVKN